MQFARVGLYLLLPFTCQSDADPHYLVTAAFLQT
jgi:hypothetical protein